MSQNEGRDMSAFPSTQELRRWAQQRRPDMVQSLGTLPKYVIVAWNRANPDRPFVPRQAYHGTLTGYHRYDCRCLGCVGAYRRLYQAKAAEQAEALADELLSGGAS